MPEVSVIIPTHNRRQLMPRTLGSALAQEDVELEVIVVDDGSTDGTADYLASIDDPRVTALAAGGHGVANARNLGIEAARGEWIAFLDDDDLWSPWKLRRQLDAARGTDAGMVFSAICVVRPDLTVIEVVPPPPLDDLAMEVLAATPIPAGASNVLARAGLVRATGGFRAEFRVVEDWDMWIRLIHLAPARKVEDVDVAYVEHPGAMSVMSYGQVEDSLALLRGEHRELSERYDREPGDALRFWYWLEGAARRTGDRRVVARLLARRAVRFRRPMDVVRAGVMLVGGEPGMTRLSDLADTIRPAGADSVPAAPEWLTDLRP